MGAVLGCMSMKEKGEEEKRSPTVPKKILNQIFLKLPVKTLLKFKCVCKEWIYILEDPEFVDSHRIKSHTRSGGIGVLELNTSLYKPVKQDEFPALFMVDPDKEKDSELTRISLPTGLKMYTETPQCVEGLICFENFVVNPSTREVIELPDQSDNWDFTYCLNYIGYHSRSKTYKVLSLIRISDGMDGTTHVRRAMLHGQILTLGTTHSNSNSWRDVIMPANYKYLSWLIHAYLSVDNKIFFLISLDCDKREKKQRLLAFEIEDERFIMSLEELPWDPSNRVSTLEVNGRFAVMEMNPARKRERTLWVLVNYKGNGGTWTKRKIVFPAAIFHLTNCFPVGNIIHSGSGEILFKAWGPPDPQPLNPFYEILFKAWERPPVPQPLKPGRFFYFYYNMETNSFRVGKKTDSADIWFSKNVETMFQLQPRPQPFYIQILKYKLRHMQRKY